MSDTISRDAAIRALIQAHEETGVKTAQAIRIIREQPDTEPEIVRCKDCKWFDMSDIAGTIEPICYRCKRFARTYRRRDDFCSYGERREEAKK